MDTDLNHVTLTGVLERDPITRFADHGTQQVHFTLKLIEPGPAGQAFTLFVPVAGKLKWTSYTTKDGSKKSTLAVLARLSKALVPAPALSGTSP